MQNKRRNSNHGENHRDGDSDDETSNAEPGQPLDHNLSDDERRQSLKLNYRARLIPKDSIPVNDLRDHTDDHRKGQHAQRHPADSLHPGVKNWTIENSEREAQRRRDQ